MRGVAGEEDPTRTIVLDLARIDSKAGEPDGIEGDKSLWATLIDNSLGLFERRSGSCSEPLTGMFAITR